MLFYLVSAMVLTFFLSFWMGFTDAAYAISTVIGTRTLKPIFAVCLATTGNFVGMIFGSAVAFTMGTGIVSESVASGEVILTAMVGALVFDVIFSWGLALPISETHVLVGGLIGSGFAAGGLEAIRLLDILSKIVVPMIIAPPASIAIVFMITLVIIRASRKMAAPRANRYFRRLQILTSLILSATDGTNDAQKTMGIATVLLMYYGHLSEFAVPAWVMMTSYATLSMGTFLGGWRIVKTMATRITKIRPYQGFSAEAGSALILGSTALLGLPVSSTHVTGGAIMGTGLAHRAKSVKWVTSRRIVFAWVLSVPVPALFSFILYRVVTLF